MSTAPNSIVEFLDIEQRTILFKEVQTKLPMFSKTAAEFRCLLQFLTQDQRDMVFAQLKDNLPELINDFSSFSEVFEFLTVAQRDILLDRIKEKMPDIISKKDIIGFARSFYLKLVLKPLTDNQRELIFNEIKGNLSRFITKAGDYIYIYEVLNATQRIKALACLSCEESQRVSIHLEIIGKNELINTVNSLVSVEKRLNYCLL